MINIASDLIIFAQPSLKSSGVSYCPDQKLTELTKKTRPVLEFF